MEIRYLSDPERYKTLGTWELRKNYLLENLFGPGELRMVYTDLDRAIVGSAVPRDLPLALRAGAELASEYFAERREIGVVNVGNKGMIRVDEKVYTLENSDFLYIGRGSRDVEFASDSSNEPAQFYFVSYPAHAQYPVTHAPISQAEATPLGSVAESNRRTIYKMIHPKGIKSCQLVMGLTVLDMGCVWNTMSPHTHERRTEVYLYFDLPEKTAVFHFMGAPRETRNIVVRDRQVVLSPSWSIHAGAGTKNYKFIWAMGGENQEFGDMDAVKLDGIF